MQKNKIPFETEINQPIVWDEKQLEELNKILKSLANPIRLKILLHLAECKTCINGDLVDLFPLSRTTIYQHLNELKKIDLIQGEVKGANTCFCLNVDKFNTIKNYIYSFFETIPVKLTNSCC